MKSAVRSASRFRKRPYRARKTIYELPPLELECMKAVWTLEEASSDGGGVSVRQIRQHLAAERRPLAYTTVETIMDRLTRKQAVEREKHGKAHYYRPIYQKQQARTQAVEALVEHFFSGSRQALQAHLEGRSFTETEAVGSAHRSRGTSRASDVEKMAPSRRREAGPRKPSHEPQSSPGESPLDTTLL
jgi:predicted transcriptional regulator